MVPIVLHKNTALKLSQFGLGNWLSESTQMTQNDWDNAVDICVDAGINWFDTADSYNQGIAEKMLACALSRHNRSLYFISTKCFFAVENNSLFDNTLSKKKIIDSANDSLRRMNIDYIDLFYLHRYDSLTPLIEIVQAIKILLSQGKILYWGISKWPIDKVELLIKECSRSGVEPPRFYQDVYNVFQSNEISSKIKNLGLSFIGYSILARGVLTAKYLKPQKTVSRNDTYPNFMYDLTPEKNKSMIKFSELAKAYDISPTHLIFQYYNGNPLIEGYLFGVSSLEQLQVNLKSIVTTIKNKDELIKEVDKIFKPWNVK